jgi:hypothetical protein
MRRLLPVFLLTSIGLAALAEVLTMPAPPETAQAPANKSVVLPGRGMTMTDVEEKFGIPLKKYPEVGDPPIIRWVYPDFTVYFEYHYVINAVPSHVAPPPAPPEEKAGPAKSETTAPAEAATPASE